jgi:hypothetical protein
MTEAAGEGITPRAIETNAFESAHATKAKAGGPKWPDGLSAGRLENERFEMEGQADACGTVGPPCHFLPQPSVVEHLAHIIAEAVP